MPGEGSGMSPDLHKEVWDEEGLQKSPILALCQVHCRSAVMGLLTHPWPHQELPGRRQD